MAVLVNFMPASMSSAQYDNLIQELDKAGENNPEGRMYHVCYGNKNNLKIFGVWDSKNSFERFNKVVKPIVQKLGIRVNNIEVTEIYNLIEQYIPISKR